MDDSAAVDAAAAFQRLHPRAFLQKFVNQGVRPDGRSLAESRPLSIEKGVVSATDGSGRVTLGDTIVLCGVRFLVGEPGPARDQGSLEAKVHLTPVCSPVYDGHSSEQAVPIASFLTRIIRAGLVDLKALCVLEDTAAFHLKADIVCLADDGNLEDACLNALVAALEDLRLPEIKMMDGQGGQSEIVQVGEERPHKVTFGFKARSTTFGMFDGHVLLDPTVPESDVLDGKISVVLDEDRNIVATIKPGGPPLSFKQLEACIDKALTP